MTGFGDAWRGAYALLAGIMVAPLFMYALLVVRLDQVTAETGFAAAAGLPALGGLATALSVGLTASLILAGVGIAELTLSPSGLAVLGYLGDSTATDAEDPDKEAH